MLFTKEFLDKLQKKSEEVSILDFLMIQQEKSFQEAIREIAAYCEMQPEFITRYPE